MTHENFHKNVNENICNFAIFGRIFMKLSPKCRTKNWGMIYTNSGSFYFFLNWEGPIFSPKSGLGKSLQLSMKFILLINVKMPTIVGILTFMNKINTTSASFRARKIFIFQRFSHYELLKFHGQLTGL